MKVTEQLRELESVAEALGVRVSYEPMTGLVSGAGGMCRVKGEYRVIIDRRLRTSERITLLADALRRFDTASIEMSSVVRRALAGGAGNDPGNGAGNDADAGNGTDGKVRRSA